MVAPAAGIERGSSTALLDDDLPILVIEDLPAGRPLIPEDDRAKPFLSRTLTFRYDTAAVGAGLGTIAIAVAFLLGRASVDAVADPAPPAFPVAQSRQEPGEAPPAGPRGDAEPQVAGTAPARTFPALSTSADLAPPPSAPRGEPAAAPPVSAGLPEPPAATAAPEARYWITVLQKGTREGAEDVKKLLESKRFLVTLDRAGSGWNVRVGAYPDRDAPELRSDLAELSKIPPYKGVDFARAYPEPIKRNQ
jgi:hypothetical protein